MKTESSVWRGVKLAGGKVSLSAAAVDDAATESGDAFLAEMYHNLADVLAARPNAVVVPAAEGATEETYQAILANLREGV